MPNSHEIFIGDKIVRALEIIGAESDEYDRWELIDAYGCGDLRPRLERRGNYLYVEVDTETLED